MEEKKKNDEEQKIMDDRKNRLMEKLDSMRGADEEKSPGFMEQAQDNQEQYKSKK